MKTTRRTVLKGVAAAGAFAVPLTAVAITPNPDAHFEALYAECEAAGRAYSVACKQEDEASMALSDVRPDEAAGLKRKHRVCREALDRASEREAEAWDRFLSTPARTSSGVLCKLRAAGEWIRMMEGSEPRDIEDRLALSAQADLERLAGEASS